MIAKKSQLAIVYFVCLITMVMCGCATLPIAEREMTPNQDDVMGHAAKQDALRASVGRYRLLAIQYEKNQQFYKAVFMWRVVQKLAPDDRHAGYRIRELEQLIRSEADEHFLKGADYAKQNSFLSARNEFLMTLAYDPNQKSAIDSLRDETASSSCTMYETRQGDTMKKIAQKVYLDPEKYFIVAYFGKLSNDADLKPGMVLKLPVIKAEPKPKQRQIARPYPPRMQKASNKAGAEDHYRKGVSFFLAEDMQRAIKEWEETLSIDPEHPNARRNIEKARNLLKKGQLK
ncbi:MAG: hypothetical protein ABFD82_17020 [Syntrophaceae bacterium]